MRRPRRHRDRPPGRAAACLLVAAAAACGSGAPSGDHEPPPPAPAPWSAPPLPDSAVPAVLLEAWRDADNAERCGPLAPAVPEPSSGGAGGVVPAGAEPRRATFAGGWGVAWDLPGTRSAFGVAGTGVEASADTYDEWPHHVEWADGSAAGYGPEGGSGPNQLAYLRVAGQACLYNVWSRLGLGHLEELLQALRRVDTGWTGPGRD